MHFMLQKEVVNRLVAGPNSKAYGRLTVMAQYYCNVIPVLEVPPTAFSAAEGRFRRVPGPAHRATPNPVATHAEPHHHAGVRNQRRKTIRNSQGSVHAGAADGAGASISLRAEYFCGAVLQAGELLSANPAPQQ